VLAHGLPLLETEQVFDSCTLGVDPGLTTLGMAVVARRDRRPALLFAGTIRTPAELAEPSRLRLIHEGVRDAIAEHRPDAVAVERVMWNTNQRSALHVARATGVVLLAAAEAGVPVDEYGPLEVKMAVTGQGNADKRQIRDALVRLHGLEGVPAQPDAADAVAVALCHLTQSRLRRVAGGLRRGSSPNGERTPRRARSAT
jgi:crossover junction endodeoxyribonuclease RuvC